MNKKPGIITDRRFFNHAIPLPSHENPDRLRGLYQSLSSPYYQDQLKRYAPREATDAEIYAVHSIFYIEQLREFSLSSNPYCYDNDTYLMSATLNTAKLGAGGCLELADRIMRGEIDYGFALIRPPGHHAEAGMGKGFCVLNNAAITAKYLLARYDLSRIMIFDFDVHHGNGTQEIFYSHDTVLVLSLHQENIFPFTGKSGEVGEGRGEGYNINVPIPSQCGDREYSYLCGNLLGSLIEQYAPQIILVCAGYDGHEDDPIGNMALTTSWYGNITEMLKYFSGRYCDNRLLFILEGGYNHRALHNSVVATLKQLMCPVKGPAGIPRSERAEKILRNHPARNYWAF